MSGHKSAIAADTMQRTGSGNQIEVIHTRVFAATRNGGSPCPVIPFADSLTSDQMQRLARRFGLDTVFLLKPRSKQADVGLRYFVPDHEMGISGHATIAAVTIGLRKEIVPGSRCRIETISGLFEVTSTDRRGAVVVTLNQNRPQFGSIVAPEEVLAALGIAGRDLAPTSPIQPVSVSRAKLLVPLRDWRVLDRLEPDFEALWCCCERLNVTGFYPFTKKTNKPHADLEARQFPLRAGFAEDAATGVAAGALGAYITAHDRQCARGLHSFRVTQGFKMGAPSVIETITECKGGQITRTAIRGVAQEIGHEYVPVPF